MGTFTGERRRVEIAVAGWLFLCIGAGSLLRGALRFAGDRDFAGMAAVAVSALAAIVAGAYLLRGRGWARWLCAGWLAFHVVLSLGHSRTELAVHGVLFLAICLVLFRPAAGPHFRRDA